MLSFRSERRRALPLYIIRAYSRQLGTLGVHGPEWREDVKASNVRDALRRACSKHQQILEESTLFEHPFPIARTSKGVTLQVEIV